MEPVPKSLAFRRVAARAVEALLGSAWAKAPWRVQKPKQQAKQKSKPKKGAAKAVELKWSTLKKLKMKIKQQQLLLRRRQ